jgi:hypothetical protein
MTFTNTSDMAITDIPVAALERRTTSRFPLEEEVTYKVQGKIALAGVGKCVNIGSGGVLFTTNSRLPIGRTVEVAVNWPALLDGACPLRFIATGPVVRSEETRAAIRIDRYEFRTRGGRAGLLESLGKLGPSAVIAPAPRLGNRPSR